MHVLGSWIPQRSIGRQKVTAIKFVDEGDALVGGTEDGTLSVLDRCCVLACC